MMAPRCAVAVMMMAEGYSMAGQPAAKISEAKMAATQILEVCALLHAPCMHLACTLHAPCMHLHPALCTVP